ncbi:FMN-dependent NADH-azoreductase [Spongiimicrobium salis]|uniref:FMN-dependent NADH-azoreductase n=1 Tax=Spongiimicrobium salis TaxID=1667022 RepID=UPI00374DBE71
MKKTLIVSYTPRIDSNTKKLVDHFVARNASKTDITLLELSEEAPDLLLKENLNLYVQRNFAGLELNEQQQHVLAKNDKMRDQLLDADFIVLASPIYNMSVPATVKAWIDAIIQAGETFESTATGIMGLCENKKALVLMTSGSDFAIEPLKSVNFATTLASACLGLIGIPSETITAFGFQQYAHKSEKMIAHAKKEIDALSEKWY